ncbi:hypothetical protein GCM10010293_64560 [Streptomyces griseoflavus]|nr:hypothetical protein GCM10010293_64560 [Streptomyces griseoflavus]
MAAAKASAVPAVAARGGRRSAADIRSVAPRTWARDGPNMLRADSRGEAVCRWTSVARARPLVVRAGVRAEAERGPGAGGSSAGARVGP